MREYALRSAFEGEIGSLEEFCMKVAGVLPDRFPTAPMEPEWREWYGARRGNIKPQTLKMAR